MSHRPVEAKKRRRVAKALRKVALPRYFDLVQWLVDNKYASTKRAANQLILDKRVQANSHTLGVNQRKIINEKFEVEVRDVVAPHVLVDTRPDIIVLSKAPATQRQLHGNIA